MQLAKPYEFDLARAMWRSQDTNEKFIQRNLSIKKAHEDYFKKNKNSLIYINRDNLNFEKEEDLQKVIESIKQKITD